MGVAFAIVNRRTNDSHSFCELWLNDTKYFDWARQQAMMSKSWGYFSDQPSSKSSTNECAKNLAGLSRRISHKLSIGPSSRILEPLRSTFC